MTVHYNVAVRLDAAVRQVAHDTGIVLSPWHPGAVPRGTDGEPFRWDRSDRREVRRHPQQIVLACQRHRSEHALPIPGTTSIQHLKENLAAADISMTQDEVGVITAPAREEN